MEQSNMLLEERCFDEVFCDGSAPTNLCRTEQVKILLTLSGTGVLLAAGKAIPCQAGDVFVIRPTLPHRLLCSGETPPPVCRILSFSPEEWLCGDFARAGSPQFCYGVFEGESELAYVGLDGKAKDSAMHLLDALEKELAQGEEAWESAAKAHLSLLLIALGRYVKSAIKSMPSVPQKEWSIAHAALSEVKAGFADSNLTLETIADRLYVSHSHLSRLFKELTGERFSDYIRKLRLTHACRLLESSSLTVAEVMAACGLRDLLSFYRNFSGFTGMTPHEYRTAHTNDCEKKQKGEPIMSILNEISEYLQKGRAKIVCELIEKALAEGCLPEDILNEGLLAAMSIIGEKFKNNEIFVPEVLIAARAMNAGVQVLKPYLVAEGIAAKGRVCIGTVQGDLHDIGKNLVKMLFEGKGLEVVDLGTDVPPEKFVQTAIEQNCSVICCSALLTTTMPVMESVVRAAEEAGIRDRVKIMIGGAPVSEEFCHKIGADLYTPDAASAADAALRFCTEKQA